MRFRDERSTNEERDSPNMQFIDLVAQQVAIRGEIDRRIKAVLDHGQYIMGPEVAELEQALAAYTNARHCVTAASGTEALLMALMALGIGPGDEVITTPFTFAATAEVIVLAGARPVFVDVDVRTANIDPALIAAKITDKTKAIVPVSLYGQTADMDKINEIARSHGGLPVIEDAAQSFGATYKGRKSCATSLIGCTSFFPSKPLGCYGDGGALFTDSDDIARAAREIRVHGQSKRYVHTRIGLGGRMDTLQCAVVLAKLTRFADEVDARMRLGARYTRLIEDRLGLDAGAPNVDVSKPPARVMTLKLEPERTSVYGQYTVVLPDRARVMEHFAKAGIPTAVHYPVPLNEQPAYAAYCCADCTPVSGWLARHVMSLPMGPYLSEADQDRVVEALAQATGY